MLVGLPPELCIEQALVKFLTKFSLEVLHLCGYFVVYCIRSFFKIIAQQCLHFDDVGSVFHLPAELFNLLEAFVKNFLLFLDAR